MTIFCIPPVEPCRTSWSHKNSQKVPGKNRYRKKLPDSVGESLVLNAEFVLLMIVGLCAVTFLSMYCCAPGRRSYRDAIAPTVDGSGSQSPDRIQTEVRRAEKSIRAEVRREFEQKFDALKGKYSDLHALDQLKLFPAADDRFPAAGDEESADRSADDVVTGNRSTYSPYDILLYILSTVFAPYRQESCRPPSS